MVTGHFGPAGHIDMGFFSLSCERVLFTFQPDFFTKLKVSKGAKIRNLTPAHLSIHTHIIMHTHIIITFRLWPKQPKTEMTHSENWPK